MVQKVQKLAVAPLFPQIYLSPGVLKEIILVRKGLDDIHECNSHGMLCLVNPDSIEESLSFYGGKSKIKRREETEKFFLEGFLKSKCPELKSMALCHKGLRYPYVEQEEVDRFLLSRTA